ncbi:hypothetical protein SO694_00059152 [Aureococcus anophagefferens]|uniref:PDZ domain-containing protein n=1 Tax=Aureococcus anophagefferens TaxID=44056 RepID=A0ABR1FYN3_AURAN
MAEASSSPMAEARAEADVAPVSEAEDVSPPPARDADADAPAAPTPTEPSPPPSEAPAVEMRFGSVEAAPGGAPGEHYYTKITNWIKRKASAENVSRARAAEAAREAAALARPGPSAAASASTFRAALGISVEADAAGDVVVAEVFASSVAHGRVKPGDRLALVDGERLRSRPRPLALTFERRDDARIAARRPIKKRGRSEEEEPEEAELRLAAASEARGRFPPGPAKAESTQKKYWRARIDDDLAPRDAALQFAEADGTIDDVPLEPALLGLPPPRPPPPTKRGAEYPAQEPAARDGRASRTTSS